MLDALIGDVAAVFRAVFLNGNPFDLALAYGSAFVASLLMRGAGQGAPMTFVALALYALGGLLRGALAGGAQSAGPGARAAAGFEAGWSALMAMSIGALLAYFIAFMAVVLVFYTARSILAR